MNGNCKIENSTDTKKTANPNSIEEIIEDLKNGRIVLVTDDENRENEGDLICAAQFATTENVNFMAKYGRGLICMPVSQKIAERLELFPMTSKNTDNHETAFTVSIDHISTTTGISAVERSVTAISCADKNSSPRDFRRPGHLFPLIAVEGGVLVRNGHTEATVDLCKIAGLEECGLCCEIMAEDGTMLRAEGIKKFALEHNLKMTSIKELQKWRKSHEILLEKTDEVFLPTEYGEFKMAAFTDKLTGKEHSALIKGDIAGAKNVLCRIHSECLTGDVFGSMRCDCGKQLKKAMQEIQDAGQGIIIYLRQEGRGIGLFNKLKAYKLQENGMDTVEANEALGFAGDEREYYAAAQILNFYGIKNIRLLTNNPDKIEQLKAYNIKITERCPLQIQANEYDKKYLMTKQNKMGHLFKYD